jgi:hypothetical protein
MLNARTIYLRILPGRPPRQRQTAPDASQRNREKSSAVAARWRADT